MIAQIMELLNETSNIQIIENYTKNTPPTKPYAAYTIINTNSKDLGYTYSYYDENKKAHIEKSRYRETATIQFDIYTINAFEALNKGKELRNLIIFVLRKEWTRIETGIVSFTAVESKREEIKSKYEYWSKFDVTFEYMTLTAEREVQIAEIIDLIAKKIKKEEE